MKIEVSNGEIIDKHTILSIKLKKIKNEDKLKNIQKEYNSLTPHVNEIKSLIPDTEFENLYNNLVSINEKLWIIEDELRILEKEKKFDSKFIDLARSVYHDNDFRAEIKKQINIKTKSDLIEEKDYITYK